jgi:soluble lytic murein transglycosylase-like protein
MKQFLPAVRALCEQVRQPGVIRLFVGLGLIAPAALFSKTMDRPLPVQELAAVVVAAPVQPTVAAVNTQDSLAAAEAPDPKKYAQEYRVSEPLANEIHKAAVATGIAPKIAFGLVRAESSFRTRAVSPVGAVGLTQLMPATARWLKPGTTRRELMQPKTNLQIGFTYLKKLIDRYEGNEKLALTAFNRGPGTVDRALRQGRNPDNGYYDKVLTGKSAKHVSLMNAKFGKRKR